MTAPDPEGEGVVRAMRIALEEGGFTPADLGHFNAHGTGTHANELTESKALRALCGEEAGLKVPVCSVKGTTATRSARQARSRRSSRRFPSRTIACRRRPASKHPTPRLPPTCSPSPFENYKQKVALSNSLGFGGHNACLAISPYEVAAE